MTWKEYIEECGKELALHRTRFDFDKNIERIQNDINYHIRNSTLPFSEKHFWKRVIEEYDKAPKLLLKEAAAAKSLNDLVTAAQEILAAKVKSSSGS